MMSNGINLVMTVIGFAVSTMFIVFVCTRLICARIQLSASRRSFPLASRSDLSIVSTDPSLPSNRLLVNLIGIRRRTKLERGLHGLEPVVVSNFPTKKYSDEFFSTIDDTQCTVCLAEYHHEDMLRILPNCGHSFHANCIDIWLQQHSTCPVCRISLREFSEKRRIMQPLFSSALRSHRGPGPFLVHSPNCVYAGQSFQSRTVGWHHACPIQEDNHGPDSIATEARESIPTANDDQSQLSGNKVDRHLESPSNGQFPTVNSSYVGSFASSSVVVDLTILSLKRLLKQLVDLSLSPFL
ncbi:hypothetical protein CDL15_Pgr026132 [Punica granatum]|uniref:RING-type E3 ubiquitin transferase n=1 Tax=Punica granatum TaxID=22663 RepID=A0A218WDY6_PUNGR|nr:hypothetical protein CDL15_Pgr026132 [Punica granatum]